jgi:hypothetical protein
MFIKDAKRLSEIASELAYYCEKHKELDAVTEDLPGVNKNEGPGTTAYSREEVAFPLSPGGGKDAEFKAHPDDLAWGLWCYYRRKIEGAIVEIVESVRNA